MRADREATSSSAWGERGIYVTGAALVAIAGISWVGVIRGVGMPVAAAQEAVSLAGAAAFLAGWGVMMAAMMLPSAMPMIALYGKLSRNLSQRDEHAVPTELFAAIYLAIWLGVGALVYLGGLALTTLADAIPLVAASLPYALAAVLVGAGAYQLTALKQACLRSCRTPLSFLMRGWQGSYAGTLKLAGAHAA